MTMRRYKILLSLTFLLRKRSICWRIKSLTPMRFWIVLVLSPMRWWFWWALIFTSPLRFRSIFFPVPVRWFCMILIISAPMRLCLYFFFSSPLTHLYWLFLSFLWFMIQKVRMRMRVRVSWDMTMWVPLIFFTFWCFFIFPKKVTNNNQPLANLSNHK